jgi:glucose dehydrogenase
MVLYYDIKGLGTLIYTYFVTRDPRAPKKLYALIMSSALTNWTR